MKRALQMAIGLGLALTTLQYEARLVDRAIAAVGGEVTAGDNLRPPIDVQAALDGLTAALRLG